jgi:hypothetical protein
MTKILKADGTEKTSATSGTQLSVDSGSTMSTADLQDGGDIDFSQAATVITAAIKSSTVTNAQHANMAQHTIKARVSAGAGAPQDVIDTDLTEEASPAAGDWLLGWDDSSNIRKYDIGNLPATSTETVTAAVRKGSAGTITKGSPVYISGYNVGGWVEVEEADANVSAEMPALGIANESITNAATANVVVSGQVSDINTSSWTENDALYVSETVGTLTNVRPTGATSGIQSVARVLRSNITNGVIEVLGAGRTNDVPNLTDGKFWVGNGSNVATEVNMSSDATMDNTGAVTVADGADGTAIHDNVAGEINAIGEKASPVGTDLIIIEDSADSNNKKKVQITNLPAGGEVNDLAVDGINGIADDQLAVGTGASTAAYQTLPNGVVKYDTTAGTFSLGTEGGAGTDTTAIHDDTSGEINAVTEKVSPVGADVILIEDSAATYAKKRVQITNLPAGSEINALVADGVSGIADDQLAVGTGAGTAAYQTLPNGAVKYDTTGGTFSQAASTDLSDSATLVSNDQANSYSTGAQDFSSATSLTVPVAAGAAPTASGQIAYDSTANQLEYGDNATNRIVVNTDEAQTLSSKTLTTPTIGDFTNAGHNHTNAAGGGQLDHTTALTNVGTNTHAQIDTHLALTDEHLDWTADQGATNINNANITGLLHGTEVDNPTTAHGATGAVMGTTNTQTVTNKDLTAESNKLRHSKSITVEDPADGDRLAIFMNERAVTVLGVSFASLAGTSVLFNLEFATTIASGTVIHTDTCASSTPEWDVTPSGDATIPTDQIVLLEITTVTGSVTDFHVTIYYDED